VAIGCAGIGAILDLRGGQPSNVHEILISETMRLAAAGYAETAGLWEPKEHRIVIKRAELRSLEPLCSVPPAEGAFYCCLRVNVKADPMRVAERLIREHKVAVIPATAFGLTNGCYFRVAYGALEKATVAEGIGRLVTGLRTILS